jgi:phosphate transport system protein
MLSHTSKQYEAELDGLREKLLAMGTMVEEMLVRSVEALVRRDVAAAQAAIARDAEVDALEMEIDALCVHILARRQPAARDLRFLTMALKIDTDLERIGDLACNIARKVVDLQGHPQDPDVPRVAEMSETVREMVDECLDAFVREDPSLAHRVLERERIVDEANRRIFDRLIARMAKEPELIPRDQHLIGIAKHLERIADHATNVAEMVIFAAEGKDVRHGHLGDSD